MNRKNFDDRIERKIRGNAGESIAETLVALLISALALAMLAAIIATSSRMITSTRTRLREYYDENEKMVSMSDASSGEVTITEVTDDGESSPDYSLTVPVKYYINDELSNEKVVAYVAEENSSN